MGDSMDYYTFYEHAVGIERIKWTGSQGIGLCPLPAHNDTQPSFSFHRYTGLWNCFGCGWKCKYKITKDQPFPCLKEISVNSVVDATNFYLNEFYELICSIIHPIMNPADHLFKSQFNMQNL